jgi:hypothetical protein
MYLVEICSKRSEGPRNLHAPTHSNLSTHKLKPLPLLLPILYRAPSKSTSSRPKAAHFAAVVERPLYLQLSLPLFCPHHPERIEGPRNLHAPTHTARTLQPTLQPRHCRPELPVLQNYGSSTLPPSFSR